MMRHLLEALIQGIPGMSVSGLAGNGWEARIELTRRRPDLVLMDEILPGESSLDLLQEMVALQIPVVLLTGIQDSAHPVPPQAIGRIVKPGWDSLDQDQERFQKALQAWNVLK